MRKMIAEGEITDLRLCTSPRFLSSTDRVSSLSFRRHIILTLASNIRNPISSWKNRIIADLQRDLLTINLDASICFHVRDRLSREARSKKITMQVKR